MTLLFEDEYGKPLPFDARKLALEVAEHCLDYEGCPYEAADHPASDRQWGYPGNEQRLPGD